MSCWIPDFVRKVMKIFEIFFQPSGPVGKPDQPVHRFNLLERRFGWFDLFVLVLGYSESELNFVCLVGFLNL